MNLYNVLEYIHNRCDGNAVFYAISDPEAWSKAAEVYEYAVYNGFKDVHKHLGMRDMDEFAKIKRMIIIGWIPWQDYKWVEKFKYEFTGRESQIEEDSPGKIPPPNKPWEFYKKKFTGIRGKFYSSAHIIYLNWLTIKGDERINWRVLLKDTGIQYPDKKNMNTIKRCGSTLIRLFISGWIPKEDPIWLEKYVLGVE